MRVQSNIALAIRLGPNNWDIPQRVYRMMPHTHDLSNCSVAGSCAFANMKESKTKQKPKETQNHQFPKMLQTSAFAKISLLGGLVYMTDLCTKQFSTANWRITTLIITGGIARSMGPKTHEHNNYSNFRTTVVGSFVKLNCQKNNRTIRTIVWTNIARRFATQLANEPKHGWRCQWTQSSLDP